MTPEAWLLLLILGSILGTIVVIIIGSLIGDQDGGTVLACFGGALGVLITVLASIGFIARIIYKLVTV